MGQWSINPGEFSSYARLAPEAFVREWPFGDITAPRAVPTIEYDAPLAAIPSSRPVRLLGRVASADPGALRLVRDAHPTETVTVEPSAGHSLEAGRLLRGVDVTVSVTLRPGFTGARSATLLRIMGIEQPAVPGYIQGEVVENKSTAKVARLHLQTAGGVVRLFAPGARMLADPLTFDVNRINPSLGTYVRARVSTMMHDGDGPPALRGVSDIYSIG